MKHSDTKFEAIIFDLDGTLADSIEDIGDAMNRVLQKQDFPTHSIEKYKYFVGRGLRNLVIEALPEKARKEELIEEFNQAMLEDYGKNYLVKTKTYEGVQEVVSRLKMNGFKLGVLSNKADAMTQKVVKELFPSGTFDIVLGLKKDMKRKPDPGGALILSEAMCVEPENIAYVGDTDTDMQTAKNAGMIAFGASWGFRTKEELLDNGADHILYHPEDLLNFC